MSINVICPGCGTEAKAPESAAGKQGKCRQCGMVIAIPVQNGGMPTCFMCGIDLTQRDRTKDASDNHYCVECWKLKVQRQQQVKAMAPPTNGGGGKDDGYELTPEPDRPVVRAIPSPLRHNALRVRQRVKPEKTADELYAEVPWHRRSGPLSVMVVLGGLCVGIFVIPVCFIALTGPVYERKLAAPGQLKTWGSGNRIAAVVILLFWIGLIFKVLAGHGSATVNAVATAPPPSPTPIPVQAPPLAQTLPPSPKPAVSYRASVGDVSQEGLVGGEARPVAVAPQPPRPQTITPSWPPLTEAKCQAWAKKFEEATAKGDMTYLTRNLDTNGLARRALERITVTDESLQKVQLLTDDFLRNIGDIGESLAKSRPCKVLRTRQVSGQWSAMVRCLLKEGNVDYLGLTLAPNAAGEVQVVDVFELSSGGEWSHMLRTLALPLVVSGDPMALRSLSPADRDILNNAALLGEIYRKSETKQVGELASLISQLPPSLQNDRYLSILNVKATAELGGTTFNVAVERHQRQFPNDPSLSFVTLQKYVHNKDYAKMLEALFTLDEAVGGDPFLGTLKALAYAGIGSVPQAKQCAQQAMAKEPSLAQPRRVLAYIAIEEKNYSEAIRQFTVLERELGETIPEFRDDPDFAVFVGSPEYRNWKGRRHAIDPNGDDKASSETSSAGEALATLRRTAKEYDAIDGEYEKLRGESHRKWMVSDQRVALQQDRKAKEDAYQAVWGDRSKATQTERDAARQAMLDAQSALDRAERTAVLATPEGRALNVKRRIAYTAWKKAAETYQAQCHRIGQPAEPPPDVDPSRVPFLDDDPSN